MLNNYLKIALRNLLQNKVHSLVSIFGLALGLVAIIVILIVNYSELTWDKDWKNVNEIYELEQIFIARAAPMKVDTILAENQRAKISENFSDIDHIGHISFSTGNIKITDNIQSPKSFSENVNAITPSIINIFSLKATQGNTEEFYNDKQSVIISEVMAEKLFFNENPIGKTLEIKWQTYSKADKNPNINFNYKVIAVIANTSKRSSLQRNMDVLVNDSYSAPDDPNTFIMRDSSSTYVKLKKGATPDATNQRFPDFLNKDMPGLGNRVQKPSDTFIFKLTNIQKIHLYGFNSSKTVQKIFILYCLAAVIAILATVNYVNLTTARFSRRQKEIALRKTLGATKSQVIAQFLIEALASVAAALLITFIILEPLLPWLSAHLAINLELNYFSDIALLAIIFSTALFLGLTSGFYPGVILSQIKPGVILKANKSHETSQSIKFRNLLVIFQFVISASMLVSVSIMATQLYSALHQNTGYETKNIVYLMDDKLITDKGTINSLKRKLLNVPGILAATKTMPMLPGALSEFKKTYSSTQKPEEATSIPLTFIQDIDEISLLNISFIAGKNFVAPNEDGNKPNIIINEQALTSFGFSSAQEAIGKTLNIELFPSQNTIATIVGVTSKLQLGDLNKPASPVILMRAPEGWIYEAGTLGVRFSESMNRTALITEIKNICKSFIGVVPKGELSLEALIHEQYKSQIFIAQFAYTFAAVAMLISCLGLYGLASFSAEKRTKEIGIRKVQGASIKNIVVLLLWQFTKPMILANILAWPIALYLMNKWLDNFSQRIDLWIWGPAYCLLAGILGIIIAWLTVGGQAYLVAREKPMMSLREE